MQPSSGFLILIAVFVICLLLYFQGAKNRSQPTRLKMKTEAVSVESSVNQPSQPTKKPSSPQTVPLNVMFNYNGHAFDAYEVLGVPAGSSWEDVRHSFEQNTMSDESSKDFYLAAFNAIKSRQQF